MNPVTAVLSGKPGAFTGAKQLCSPALILEKLTAS
jgi:hypothetical protein